LDIVSGTLVNNGSIRTLKPGHGARTDYRLRAELDNRGTVTVELDEDTPDFHDRAILGLQFNLDVTPIPDAPFFNLTATTELGELSFDEIAIEVNDLGTLIASVILFDLSAEPDLTEPIGHVGKIEFQPSDNSLFSGLDQGSVEIFDVEMYRDRLELGKVDIEMDGVITSKNGQNPDTDLLLVDDLEIQIRDIHIQSPAGGPTFLDLRDPNFTLNNPFLTGVQFDRLDLALDAAIVLPESTNPDDVPNIECSQEGGGVELPNEVSGVASIACVTGSWTSTRFDLDADRLQASLFDSVDISIPSRLKTFFRLKFVVLRCFPFPANNAYS